MKNLFLCSFFKDVINIFKENDFKGKSVTFIPTASKVEKVNFYVNDAIKEFEKMGITVDILDLSNANESEINTKLNTNDLIYVSGGNTFFLLQELKRSGADEIIKMLVNNGKPYIGESAGAVITSKNIDYVKKMDSVKKAPLLENYDGLALVDFYTLPHNSTFPFKKATKEIVELYGEKINLSPITNKQAIIVKGDNIEVFNN